MGFALMVEPRYTVSEYLKLEEESEVRHEYYDGEVFAMAGTSMNHNRIVGKLRAIFEKRFQPDGCDVFTENVKAEVTPDLCYAYPDLILTCSAEDRDGVYIVKNPTILVEVLSKTSISKDRGFKLRMYKQIPSLQYYLLVSQNEFYVELYSRSIHGNLWNYQSFENPVDKIVFEPLKFEILLSAIYENIKFWGPEEKTLPEE
ncbi:Uma2 family endonuclease [Dyadobacter aurulentus]|uniref:Uma2 family endonuclease n=1 Tax=Dyadobacter sp. UC 10 TaxID=2605428 RepID=UPI0011F0FACD|nr:Uma2 family endonuclease [Dyadobacter sp. UC 10]KAA0989978.1 Uma2 family endonuclease [Dyadobacter sp. UC 10]